MSRTTENKTTADIVNEIGSALGTKRHFDGTLYRWARPNTNKIVSGGMAPSYFVDDVRLIDLYFRLKRSLEKDESRSKKAENALNEIAKILDREHTELVTDYSDVLKIVRKYRAEVVEKINAKCVACPVEANCSGCPRGEYCDESNCPKMQ